MPPLLRALTLTAAAGLTASGAAAAETVIVPWNQSWDYLHPMGLDPALADPDFNATWFLSVADFAARYDGPSFGGTAVSGNPAAPASFDRGSGPGPLGYATVDYFSTPGAEVTALGRTLTVPATGNRYTGYFRTTFTTAQPCWSPRLRLILDDGALLYLDGVLVARVNRQDNSEAYMETAADTLATLNETGAAKNNEACIQSVSLAAAGAATRADAFVSVPVPALASGPHTLAVSVCNNANTSSDLCMALQLLGGDTGIFAQASAIQRQWNGPGFADDTFTFDVTVTAGNRPQAVSWTSSNPAEHGPVAGHYAPAVSRYTFPAQIDAGTLNRVTLRFTDAGDPLLTSSLTVTAPEAPPGEPLVIAPDSPAGTGFEEPAMGAESFSRRSIHRELGFTSTGAIIQDVLASGSGSKMLRFNGGPARLTTETLRIDPSVKGLRAGVTLRSYTTSATGFESDDSLRISLECSPDGLTWTDAGSVLPLLTGTSQAQNGQDALLVKLGPGIPGLPAPRSRRGWFAAGTAAGPAAESLQLPAFTAPDAGPVELEFTHRYSFEFDGTRWDGGALMMSVNGGAFIPIPGSAFTQNGYSGTVTGNHLLQNLEAFSGESGGYQTGTLLTSRLTLPGLPPGASCVLRFTGAWDESITGNKPNWEISGGKLYTGNTVLWEETFAGGSGGLTATPGWVFDDGTAIPGPDYHTFTRAALPVPPGHPFVRLHLSQPAGSALSTSEFILLDHVTIAPGLDPLADTDGDGAGNGLEDLAGTSPTDPASVFRQFWTVAAGPDNPERQRASVTLPGAACRRYEFQSSDDLLTWTSLETHFGDPAVPFIGFTGESGGPQKFWRVVLRY